MTKKINISNYLINMSWTPVPLFYSSNINWNTLDSIVKISYIRNRKKGSDGKGN